MQVGELIFFDRDFRTGIQAGKAVEPYFDRLMTDRNARKIEYAVLIGPNDMIADAHRCVRDIARNLTAARIDDPSLHASEILNAATIGVVAASRNAAKTKQRDGENFPESQQTSNLTGRWRIGPFRSNAKRIRR